MHWFILIVKMFHEKKIADILVKHGFEIYLPTQRIQKRWSDRIKVVDTLVIPRTIFIHCKEEDRNLSFVGKNMLYMMDRSTNKPAVVPDVQFETFRTLLKQTEVPINFTYEQLKPGMKVEINNAIFDRIQAELIEVGGKQKVFVRIAKLGCASIVVPYTDLRPINNY